MDRIHEEFVDRYGALFESIGQGSTSGRILGVLMISPSCGLTLDELVEEVGRSKSTVHQAITHLMHMGLVERRLDDSRKYEGRYKHKYIFNDDFWEMRLTKLDAIETFKNLIGEALAIVRETDPEDPRITNFEEIYALYVWMGIKMKEIIDEWGRMREDKSYMKYVDI